MKKKDRGKKEVNQVLRDNHHLCLYFMEVFLINLVDRKSKMILCKVWRNLLGEARKERGNEPE